MTYPKIRFKKFSKEWILTSYKEIASSFQYGLNAPATTFDGINKYLRITDIDESLRFFSKSQLTTPSVDLLRCDNYLLNLGNIVFARTGASVGKSYIYNEEDGKVYFAGFLIRMTPKMEVDPHFVFQNTFTDKFEDHVRLVSQRSGQPGINVRDLQSYQFYIAPELEEQKRISEYLCTVDSQLKECINKILSLKQIKSACLQSMFPQEGESVPKVRFKGFNEEWQEKSAATVFRTFNEKNRPDLPVLSATQDKGMVKRESIGYNIFHDVSNEATYKHILPGQFVIHLRSFQGGFAHSSIEGIASPAYTVLDFIDKKRHSDLFWKYIFSSKNFIKRLELITYGIRDGRSISFDEFKEMSFLFPSIEEQQKIAAYFENLDQQISLQAQRLEKLKQIKSACLDKMFV